MSHNDPPAYVLHNSTWLQLPEFNLDSEGAGKPTINRAGVRFYGLVWIIGRCFRKIWRQVWSPLGWWCFLDSGAISSRLHHKWYTTWRRRVSFAFFRGSICAVMAVWLHHKVTFTIRRPLRGYSLEASTKAWLTKEGRPDPPANGVNVSSTIFLTSADTLTRRFERHINHSLLWGTNAEHMLNDSGLLLPRCWSSMIHFGTLASSGDVYCAARRGERGAINGWPTALKRHLWGGGVSTRHV